MKTKGMRAVKVMAHQKLLADAAVAYLREMDCPAPDLLERRRLRDIMRQHAVAYQEAKREYEK